MKWQQAIRHLAFSVGLALVTPLNVFAQMEGYSFYDDVWTDEEGYLYAMSSIDDTPPSGCSHSNYYTTTTLTAPSSATTWYTSEGMSSSTSANTADEEGDWSIHTGVDLVCTCGGLQYFSGYSSSTVTTFTANYFFEYEVTIAGVKFWRYERCGAASQCRTMNVKPFGPSPELYRKFRVLRHSTGVGVALCLIAYSWPIDSCSSGDC